MGGRSHGQCPNPYLVPPAPKKSTRKDGCENTAIRDAPAAKAAPIKLDGGFGSAPIRLFILGTARSALRLIPEVGTS